MLLARRIAAIFFAAAISVVALVRVPLVPEVNKNLFFGEDDPQLRSDQAILELFGQSEIVIVIAVGDIESAGYLETVRRLSDSISTLPSVVSVRSLSHGPESTADARESPLWSRLLLVENGSNLIISLTPVWSDETIVKILDLVESFRSPDFQLHISGVPFLIQRIQHYLFEDLKTFTGITAAVLIVLALVFFRSPTILLGTVLACATAAAATLLVIYALGIEIGVLTANLLSIVFVLSTAHIVFLTFAASHAPQSSDQDLIRWAVRRTLHPAFWSMITTTLGFATYLTVGAKPLREFGASGSIASISSFLSAFVVFSPFLGAHARRFRSIGRSTVRPMVRGRLGALCAALLIAAATALGTGLTEIETDPALLDYFDRDSELYAGLAQVDAKGGSSPLLLVLADKGGRAFTEQSVYERAWHLQHELLDDPAVGSIMSLPMIMAEAGRSVLAKLIPWDFLLDIVEATEHQEAVANFLTPDRKLSLLFLRMREEGRAEERQAIITRILAHAHQFGFDVPELGGVYLLEQRMGELLSQSMKQSLATSAPLFFLSALVLTRSARISLAIVLSLTIPALIVLGLSGALGIPLDLVSIPSVTLATAMGVDSMLHLSHEHQLERERPGGWIEQSARLSVPISCSTAVIGAGFSVLFLSNFPPSRRFGLFIVLGMGLAAASALIVLPRVAMLLERFGRRSGSRYR